MDEPPRERDDLTPPHEAAVAKSQSPEATESSTPKSQPKRPRLPRDPKRPKPPLEPADPSPPPSDRPHEEYSERSPRGLDDDKHAAAQKAAHQAEVLATASIPASMTDAFATSSSISPHGFRIYLDRVLEDSGNPKDPLKRMLIEQVVFMHLRLAELHVQAAQAKTLEGIKILNTVCSRILGEMRRTIQAVDESRERRPAAPKMRIAKVV
jgi:hypothetical protein